jgi:non-specific serine/threonine protein kinase
VPRARAIQAEVETLAAPADDPVLSAIAARALGTVEMVDGRLDAALPHLERSLDLLGAASTPHSLALVSHADLGVVLALTGDHDKAELRCEEGRELCAAQGETWALSWILFVLNFVRLVRDEHDDTTGDLEQMLRIKRGFDDVLGVLHATELLAWVVARRDPQRAALILGATEALWRPFGRYLLSFGPYLARHDGCVAQIRERLGEERFEECRRAGAAMDLPTLAAYALGEHVDVGPASSKQPDDHGLTAREREICGLVAQGLTDRLIAERLVISPRTVQTHVANILGKLGFRSRTEVTTWARTQGLADSP